jgi:hypothetical protein
MEEGPGIRHLTVDPSTWDWELPAAARQRLDGLAHLADTDRLGRGKPLPAKHSLRILGELLDHLFPDGTAERLPETAGTLDPTQRGYLAALISKARSELDRRQAEAPSILLGFPPDTRGRWANLLDAGWVPWQADWIGIRRD